MGLFAGDGQHLLDRLGMLGVTVGRKVEEGMDRSEAGVAGGDAVGSIVFEVIEEAAHQRSVEVRQVQLGGPVAGLRLGVAQQQPEGVAVGVDGVRAGISLAAEPTDEEACSAGGDGGHSDTALAAWTPSLARANSSGTAVKYQ